MIEKQTRQLKTYKRLFWGLLILDVLFAITLLWSNNKQGDRLDQRETQYASVVDSTNVLKEQLDSTIFRLDSLTGLNEQLMVTIGRPVVGDTTKLTPAQKQLLALSDSVFKVKDSIDNVRMYMNDSISLKDLTDDEKDNYFRTINTLGIIKIKLDLTLDKQRLDLVKQDNKTLELIIKKFDARKERISKLTKRLTSLTNIIKKIIDVLVIAANNKIIVAPGKATP